MRKLFLASLFHQSARLLPKFHTDLAGRNVCLIPTAAVVETETWHVDSDQKALEGLGMRIDRLEVSTASSQEIEDKIAACDFIFVSGGNTFFLLQELRRTGADKLITEHIDHSKLYISTSAGSMVLAKDIGYARFMDPPEKAPLLGGDLRGLGILDFAIAPHKTDDFYREACEKIKKEYASSLEIIYLDNDEVVEVLGDRHVVQTVKGL
jgi:dipeptidase E